MLSCKSVENQKNQLLYHNIITGADELRESSLAIYTVSEWTFLSVSFESDINKSF